MFHVNASQSSDSDSDDGGLEEIDFADLAQIRAEVDAIAPSTMAMDQDAYDVHEDIEEVDFADLAAIRAQVDAVEPRAAPREDVLEETFTGVYNHVKDTTSASSAMANGDALQMESLSTSRTSSNVPAIKPSIDISNPSHHESMPRSLVTIVVEEEVVCASDVPARGPFVSNVRQKETLSTSPTPSELLALKPSIDISNPSHHESVPKLLGTIVMDEEVPFSSDAPAKEPSLSTAPDIRPAILSNDLSPPPDVPAHDSHPLFVIDTAPALPPPHRSASDVILVDRAGRGGTLGDQDDELIVYVAPHPRSGPASPDFDSEPIPAVPRVKLPRTSVLTGTSIGVAAATGPSPVRKDEHAEQAPMIAEVEDDEDQSLSLAALTIDPDPTARSHATHAATKAAPRSRTKETRLLRKRHRRNKRSRMGFDALGAMVSEARLRETNGKARHLSKWGSRRRGDSDLDWGTEDEDEDRQGVEDEDEDEDAVDALSNGLGGMDIDPDLELDADAVQGFLNSMSAEGSRHVTMDDIADEARLRQEDEEGQGGPEGSSDSDEEVDADEATGDEEEEEEEEEEMFNVEEALLIGESEDEILSQGSDSDDDELSPRSNFQARLRKVRERSHGPHPKTAPEMSGDDEDVPDILPRTRGADDEEFIARIEVSHMSTDH